MRNFENVIRLHDEWCVYSTKLELILPRIFEKWKVSLRPAASRRFAAACLAEKFSSRFLILRAPIFSSKRKRKFFCSASALNRAGRRGFASARGQGVSSP